MSFRKINTLVSIFRDKVKRWDKVVKEKMAFTLRITTGTMWPALHLRESS